MTTSVDTTWKRIDAHLANAQPDVLAGLAGPADEGAIAKAESELGFNLPPAFREALRIHDGAAERPSLFGGLRGGAVRLLQASRAQLLRAR